MIIRWIGVRHVAGERGSLQPPERIAGSDLVPEYFSADKSRCVWCEGQRYGLVLGPDGQAKPESQGEHRVNKDNILSWK
jgi:hypothetical protein